MDVDPINEFGILQPPDEMKVIIDKTAEWIARKGSNLEKMVLERQENKDNPQFAFLKPGSAYHAYYQFKVRKIRAEEVIAEIGDVESIDAAAAEKMKLKKSMLGEIPMEEDLANAAPKKAKKQQIDLSTLEPPPPEMWTLEKPNIAAVQDDIIKLSAQFVARNGAVFTSGLIEREKQNRQFDFLRPNSPLHGYFKRLVQDYTRILLEKPDLETLKQKATHKNIVAEQVMKKVQWERVSKKNLDIKKQEDEAEKTAMSQIDWHEFVVVQTIEFDDDGDEEEEDDAKPESAEPKEQAIFSQLPPQTNKAAQPSGYLDDDIDMDIGEDEDEQNEEIEPIINPSQIKVKPNFDPRVKATGPVVPQFTTAVGHQPVDLRGADEQMKILLSNPLAREQKKLQAQQEKPTNLTEDREIAANLREFASRRTDMFGDEETHVGSKVGEKKKKEEKPTWDGHVGSAQGISLETQRHAASLPQTVMSIPVQAAPLPLQPTPMPIQQPQPPRATPMLPLAPQMPFPGVMRPAVNPIPGMVSPMPGMMGMPSPYVHSHPMMSAPSSSMKVDSIIESHPRPQLNDEPNAKKQKMDDEDMGLNLVPERDWLKQHSGPVNVVVSVPNLPGTKWPLHGQTLRIQIVITDTIQNLKEKVADSLGGMPANKQKLKTEELGYLKETNTLAYYNAKDGFAVELAIKERGGRKK
jgi:splicing factor 3A subunit 1